MNLFELQFCPDLCPGVELLDHMVVLYLVFKEPPEVPIMAQQ